jgi:DNA-binding response OmpR family regulator
MVKNQAKKVLIVEDDVFLSNIYNKKFSNEGFEVFTASDGKKAVIIIKQKKPDIILLDIMLPQMDGFEVLEEIKKDLEVKDIPVILLTNINEQDGIKKGYDLGAKDYIIKTFFTPAEVVDKVKKFL